MVGGVAFAQNTHREPVIDLTMVPQARKDALGLTQVQLDRMAKLQENHRNAEFYLQGEISGLVDMKKGLAGDGNLTRAREQAINKQINTLSKRVRAKRYELRLALFHVMTGPQKVQYKVICNTEKYFRPGVRLACALNINQLVPDVVESKAPEQILAERMEARAAAAEQARQQAHQRAERARQQAHQRAERARQQAEQARQ